MKKIIYFVGAYGCGKSTTVERLVNKTTRSDCMLEDKSILDMIKKVKIHNMALIENYVLMTYYYRLLEKLNEDIDYLFVDGHPIIMMIYLRANFELENGMDVNLKDLLDFGRIRFQMWKLTKDLFRGIEQEIVYINLPFEKHYDLVYNRYDSRKEDFPLEDDPDWFAAVRRVLNSEIYHIGREMYGCSITEINSLEQLDALNYGLPYPLHGG